MYTEQVAQQDDPPVWPVRVGQLIVFCCGYVMFGSVGLLTSLVCFCAASLYKTANARFLGQRLIHHLFRFFVWYLQSFGLLRLEAAALRTLRETRNLVIVANHPSLLDVVFITAQLPNIFCLMKADLVWNVVLSGQSRLAGYVNNASGVGLIKACQARLREGSNLLVFPEGTRSNGHLGKFKMGFALLARTAGAPIQTVVIRYSRDYLGKGWPFFRPPAFPLRCSIELGECFEAGPAADTQAVGRQVEDYLRQRLRENQEAHDVLPA